MGLEEPHPREIQSDGRGEPLEGFLACVAKYGLRLVWRQSHRGHQEDGEQKGLDVDRDVVGAACGLGKVGLHGRHVDYFGQRIHPVQIDLPETEGMGRLGPEVLNTLFWGFGANEQVRVAVRGHEFRSDGVLMIIGIDNMPHSSELTVEM